MTGQLTMFDSVTAGALPAGAGFCYAGYVDGEWADWAAIKDRFPHANVLSIAVFAVDDAEALDIENGDATAAQAPAWVVRQKSRGRVRPCLYASASVMEAAVVPIITAAGIDRASVRLWSAHYTGLPHICAGDTCGATSIPMDGTQWTSTYGGRSLDASLLAADFFGPPPAVPVPAWETAMLAALPVLQQGADDADLPHWWVHRIQAIANEVFSVLPRLTVDGAFGPATTVAVKQVQRRFSLTEDGICGKQTWAAILTGSVP